MWWPADEYVLIKLCVEGQLDRLYREAEQLLGRFIDDKMLSLPSKLLSEAIALNRALIKLPFQTTNAVIELSYNIWEFYQSSVRGTPLPLEAAPSKYHIDRTSAAWASWDDWCREVVWYGNKRGAYLYGHNAVEPQLAGHY